MFTRPLTEITSVTSIIMNVKHHGAKHSLIQLNIENVCLRETNESDVFDFKKCYDFNVNIKFPSVD